MIPISDCEICSHLAEVETAFYKYGWDEMTRSLPAEAGRLIELKDAPDYKENDHLEQCPICKVYYRYRFTYEYLVNGSEDETTLTRLTPADVRMLLPDAEYERLIAIQRQCLEHPEASTRFYAARCIAAHYLAQNELAQVEALLMSANTPVVDGVLYFLIRQVVEHSRLLAPTAWREILSHLAASPEQQIANRAAYLLKYGLAGKSWPNDARRLATD